MYKISFWEYNFDLKQFFVGVTLLASCLVFDANYNTAYACVKFVPQGTSNNSALFAQFVNNCSYTVVIKARTSNGYQGLWGPIKPGRSQGVNPGVNNYRINFRYTNFTDCPSCSPAAPTWPN